LRLILVRHGHADASGEGRYWGQTDVLLTELGREQVKKLRRRLGTENIDAVYSSELKRCTETAETIIAGRGLDLTRCAELNEVNFGKLEGLSYVEIRQQYPELSKLWENWDPGLSFPEGESYEQFAARVGTFTKRLTGHSDDDTVLVVGHGGVFKLLLCYLAGLGIEHWWKFRFDIGSISILDVHEGTATVSRLSDVSHLDSDGK